MHKQAVSEAVQPPPALGATVGCPYEGKGKRAAPARNETGLFQGRYQCVPMEVWTKIFISVGSVSGQKRSTKTNSLGDRDHPVWWGVVLA